MSKVFLFLFLIIGILKANGQELKTLFQSDSVLSITIKLSLEEVLNLNERIYHEAKLSYKKNDGSKSKHKIKVKIRGNNRAKVSTCQFPPLKINFKKNKLENSIFQGQNKIKLVTHCNKNKNSEQLILKEYLVYKMYQAISSYSFNVRLCEITYIDTSNDKVSSVHYGFFIEDIDDVASRNGMYEYEDSIANQEVCRRVDLDKFTVFQYMIGNLDWSIPNRHNVKLINDSENNLPIAVPYDFDFAGFVGAPYAKPPEEFDVANVKTRFFMGLCRFQGGYDASLEYYKSQKQVILSVLQSSEYLSERNQKSALKYLDSFFDMLDKPRQVNQKIIKGCRANHKHLYRYEN